MPPAYADTKTIISAATYIMGDGETPSFAEAMVLQKAKQAALEEAGTYVQSYTKTINEDLTADEIQTIAGGVIQVEVLEKTRALVEEGLRLHVKIKATVTTDKMEELARRIKGTHLAEEYKKLQEEYTRLNKEVETLKREVAKAPTAKERVAAVGQIQEREKAFASLQGSETALVQRLVSGETLVQDALDQAKEIDRLVKQVMETGYTFAIEEPKAELGDKTFGVKIYVRIYFSEKMEPALARFSALFGTEIFATRFLEIKRDIFEPNYRKGPGLSARHSLFIFAPEDSKAAQGVIKRLKGFVPLLELSYADGKKLSCNLGSWLSPSSGKGTGRGDNVFLSSAEGIPYFIQFHQDLVKVQLLLIRDELEKLVKMSASFVETSTLDQYPPDCAGLRSMLN